MEKINCIGIAPTDVQRAQTNVANDQPYFGGSTGRGELSDITGRRIRKHKKLKNRSLTRDEAHEHIVRSIAKVVLQDWYSTGYSRANALMPRIQIDDNLKKVASIPGWE